MPASASPFPQADLGAASDAVLMALSAAGDRAAFDVLATRHLPRAYTVALRILQVPEEAEEIAQDAVLRLWTHAAGFDPARADVGAWLHRITFNLAIDRYRVLARRRRRLAPLALADSIADPTMGVVPRQQQRQQARALADAVRDLPERQRRAVVLTYLAEVPAIETARRLGVSVRAVEGLLRRARRALHERLSRQDA